MAPTLPHKIVLGRDMPELTGFQETQLKLLVKTGHFPQPVRLGQRKLGWILAEVIAWQESKIAERDRADASPRSRDLLPQVSFEATPPRVAQDTATPAPRWRLDR